MAKKKRQKRIQQKANKPRKADIRFTTNYLGKNAKKKGSRIGEFIFLKLPGYNLSTYRYTPGTHHDVYKEAYWQQRVKGTIRKPKQIHDFINFEDKRERKERPKKAREFYKKIKYKARGYEDLTKRLLPGRSQEYIKLSKLADREERKSLYKKLFTKRINPKKPISNKTIFEQIETRAKWKGNFWFTTFIKCRLESGKIGTIRIKDSGLTPKQFQELYSKEFKPGTSISSNNLDSILERLGWKKRIAKPDRQKNLKKWPGEEEGTVTSVNTTIAFKIGERSQKTLFHKGIKKGKRWGLK